MKAVLCKRFGPPETLVYGDVPDPLAGEGEVVVDVHACAANFPDTLIIEGKYQFLTEPPFSPGSEVAGVLRSVGPDVTGYRPGDRVIAVPGHGGFAEQLVTTPDKLVPLPDGVAMDAAASLMVTYGTTHYALRERAHLRAGETLLVLGAAGGTGIAAIELGKLLGARVIAGASTDEKLAICQEHGADETINYSREDLKERMRELTDGRGVDVVYDPVGGDLAEAALRSTAWNGRFLVIGFTAGIPKLPANLALLKGCSIIGVFYGAMKQREPELHKGLTDELVGWLEDGRIAPRISARYPLAQGIQALKDLAQRRAVGKIVVLTDAGQQTP